MKKLLLFALLFASALIADDIVIVPDGGWYLEITEPGTSLPDYQFQTPVDDPFDGFFAEQEFLAEYFPSLSAVAYQCSPFSPGGCPIDISSSTGAAPLPSNAPTPDAGEPATVWFMAIGAILLFAKKLR